MKKRVEPVGRFAVRSIEVALVAGLSIFGCGTEPRLDVESKPDGLLGTVHARIASYGDRAETFYYLVSDDREEITLDYGQIEGRARVGERIAVHGARAGNRIEVSGYDVLRPKENEVRQPLQIAPRRRTFKVAAFLLTPEISKEALAKRIFTDRDSPAVFYRENSYGAWTLEGDVYGPYAIATTSCALQNIYAIAAEAEAAAAADGFDPASYDNLMYYLGEASTGCSYAALAEIGINEIRGFLNAKYTWYREASCVAFAQELGHNFGLLHAHECWAPPYTAGYLEGRLCPGFATYGDKYTPMGFGCGHFNAIESGALGFISGCNTIVVTRSGTFELGPIEAKCSGSQVIRISANATLNHGPQYIYLEYRRGVGSVGSDTRSPRGVYFHASAEYGGNATGVDSGDRHDFDYALNPFIIHAPLTTEDPTWTEPASGATFNLTTMGDTATVEVTIPNGDDGAPTCIDLVTPPSSPICSPIAIDAGRGDAAEADVARDAEFDAGLDASARSGGAATGGSAGAGMSGAGEGGCSCGIPGVRTSTPTPSTLLVLTALLAACRRRRSR